MGPPPLRPSPGFVIALKDFDLLSARYPAFRRLLREANVAAASGNLEAYRTAHAAVLAWEPPRTGSEPLTDHEKRVHAAFDKP